MHCDNSSKNPTFHYSGWFNRFFSLFFVVHQFEYSFWNVCQTKLLFSFFLEHNARRWATEKTGNHSTGFPQRNYEKKFILFAELPKKSIIDNDAFHFSAEGVSKICIHSNWICTSYESSFINTLYHFDALYLGGEPLNVVGNLQIHVNLAVYYLKLKFLLNVLKLGLSIGHSIHTVSSQKVTKNLLRNTKLMLITARRFFLHQNSRPSLM